MSELRKRGLVTAVICTDPFLKLGKAQSRVFGVPDLPPRWRFPNLCS
jgi:hypothetical protein